MIRRNVILPGGSSAWLLIAQVEHGRVAFEVARLWGAVPFSSPHPKSLLLQTILRHDDGWRSWERRPEIDPRTGRPLAFTELPARLSQSIWKKSIDACADLGPLSQFLTATHFVHLRRRGDSANTTAGRRFLSEYRARAEQWLADWKLLDPASNTDQLAHSALRYLQLFDAISLWLCCSELSEPRIFRDPEGRTLELLPADSPRISASPWPLTESNLRIEVHGRVVPIRAYRDTADLESVERQQFSLEWHLVPQEG